MAGRGKNNSDADNKGAGPGETDSAGAVHPYKLDCDFTQLGIGETTAKIGLKLKRDFVSLEMADELFSGKQVHVEMVQDSSEQKDMVGAERMSAVAEAKRFSITAHGITTGLTFNKEAVNLEKLSGFASFKGGHVVIRRMADLPDKKSKGGGDNGSEGAAE